MKCDDIWKEAEAAVALKPISTQNDFRNAAILKISQDRMMNLEEYFCYNSANWRDKGWCYHSNTNNWGICSSSCRFYNKHGDEVEVNYIFQILFYSIKLFFNLYVLHSF